MGKRAKLGIGIAASLLVVGGGAAVYFITKPEPAKPQSEVKSDTISRASFIDETYGIKFTFPSTLKPTTIGEADKKSNILLRLEHGSAPEYLISVKGETGLRGPAQLSKLDTLQLIANGALAALPNRYPGYSLKTDRDLTIDSIKVHEIIFSYDGPSGARAQQRLVLVSGNSDSALYISMHARESDFTNLNETVFDAIVHSISNL